VRRALLLTPVLAVSALVAVPNARSAEPASGTLGHGSPSITWTGSTPLQTFGFSGVGCDEPVLVQTCDTFALTIEELTGTTTPTEAEPEPQPLPDDVLVGIATPNVPDGPLPIGTIAEFDVYVYAPDGTLAGSGTELGSNDTVILRDPAPGTYTVAVQSPLSTNPTTEYEGRATVVEVGDDDGPVDTETRCGLEGEDSAPVRELDDAIGLGATPVVGDPDAALDGVDRSDRIELNVHAVLDGISVEQAEAIFAGAARSYEPLGIDLVLSSTSTHSFGTDDGLAIIRATKALFGGVRPEGIDIVEALVGYDIQQLNQYAIAGIADCIGGVAHDDRAFLVAEGDVAGNIAAGPFVLVPDPAFHVTAHEMGHLMGGQHHYANCVEGVESSDVRDDGTIEVSPCTLMFNSADFLGGNFDTLNGAVVRGHAHRYAR